MQLAGEPPLHLTSVGKLFLVADEAARVRAYAMRTGLSDHTQNSITDLAKLERELSFVRQQYCARDNEELELGVRCIAVGIYDDSDRLVAGLSLSAPADRLQDAWLKQLSHTALDISRSLGYRPEQAAPADVQAAHRRCIGYGCSAVPPATPPGMRVRTGRFGKLS